MRTNKFKIFRDDKGAVLLLSLLIIIFLTVLLGAAVMRSTVSVGEVAQQRQKQEAFYAAESGIDTAIFNLRQNGAWKPGQGGVPAIIDEPLKITTGGAPQTIGFYTINVTDADPVNGWDSRWIVSTGKDSQGVIEKAIKVRVIVESPTKFLISTMGPLHMTSGSVLNADVLARDAYFDINPSLPAPQNQIQMNGDVYYINTKTGDTNSAVKWGSGATIQKAPSITFAGVDLNRYSNLANDLMTQNQGYSYNGDLNVNLSNLEVFNKNPGNPFAPKIIYAAGNIRISGQFDNSILIVAGGNIYIDGDIVPDSSKTPIPQIGLFAKRDVIIPKDTAGTGDLSVEAFILADGGSFYGLGDKYSKGTLNFNGAISVRGNGTSAVDLNVFNTRNYNFNPDLTNARTIPFTPFIVNIIQWQECPNATCP